MPMESVQEPCLSLLAKEQVGNNGTDKAKVCREDTCAGYSGAGGVSDKGSDASQLTAAATKDADASLKHVEIGYDEPGCSQRSPGSPRESTHAAVCRPGNERPIIDDHGDGEKGDVSNKSETAEEEDTAPATFLRLTAQYPVYMLLAIAGLSIGFVVMVGIPELLRGFEGYAARDTYDAKVADGECVMSKDPLRIVLKEPYNISKEPYTAILTCTQVAE